MDLKFDLSYYDELDLKEVSVTYKERSNSTFAVKHKTNDNLSLSLFYDGSGNVANAFFSETIASESSRESKIFNVQGELIMHTSLNLATQEMKVYKMPNAELSGWFDDLVDGINSFVLDTSDCLEDIWTPTDITLFDTAFVSAATYVTGGWFIPVSIAGCGIKVALD